MIFHYKPLPKWILHAVLLSSVTVVAIGCQPQSPIVNSSPTNSVEVSTPKPVSQSQAIYRSDRFNFQFSYSAKDFVVDTPSIPANEQNSTLANIEIWTQEDGQAIRSGKYEGGTEYPPNVRVTVFGNPQNLPLGKWVQQKNNFAAPGEFKNATIAGQNAIAFQSEGLYANKHIAFNSPDDSQIIVVTFSDVNNVGNDSIYQRAFQDVVNSFTFVNKKKA